MPGPANEWVTVTLTCWNWDLGKKWMLSSNSGTYIDRYRLKGNSREV